MNFIPLDFTKNEKLTNRDTFINLASNLFRIKFFYEEDQLMNISQMSSNPENLFYLVQGYQAASDEVEIYLKTVLAFVNGNASLEDNSAEFKMVMDFFKRKEKELIKYKIEDMDRFEEWLRNHEYTIVYGFNNQTVTN